MSSRTLPRFWPFLLAFVALLVLWVIALEMLMKPDVLATVATSPMRRLLWWIVTPLFVVLSVFVFQWGCKEFNAQAEAKVAQAEQHSKEEREKAEAAAAQAQKDHEHYTLEVYGLGVGVDRFPQDKLWETLQQGDPHTSILPQDPKAYPWSAEEKRMGYAGITGYEYITAISSFTEKWELPFLLGGPPLHNAEDSDRLRGILYGARTGGGMHYHRFRFISQVYDDCPDQLPFEVFELFDQYPDLPATAIAVEDSLAMRDFLAPPNTPPRLKDGYEFPKLTSSATVLLLARRDRVDPLRPTATDTPIEDIQIPFETYFDPDTDHVLSYDDAPPEPQLPDRSNHLRPFWEAQGGAPAAFKPSRFVKRPWCKEQLAQFDALKILARVHRPQTAQYVKDGKSLGPKEREQAFLEAWHKALATLPEGQKPARVVYEYGPKGATHLAPLTIAARAAGSDLDISGKDGINVTRRLGDTGANSPYVALALGILATQKQGGITAVASLRRDDRATVMMVSPP